MFDAIFRVAHVELLMCYGFQNRLFAPPSVDPDDSLGHLGGVVHRAETSQLFSETTVCLPRQKGLALTQVGNLITKEAHP